MPAVEAPRVATGDPLPETNPALSPGNRPLYLFLLALITAAYCAWVLSLPLFPTQDGPMHLYYTQILHALLFGHSGIYPRFYAIRHLFPPYASYYYLLMLLSRFVPLVFADKIVACIYFVLFAFGFRYLARSVGRRGDLMALLATPLLLNWSLGMGFVNFCLSTAIVLWAIGLWCRAAGTPDTGKKIGFVLLAYLAMLTHPVPLLALISFCVIETVVRLARDRAHALRSRAPGVRSDLVALAAAMGTVAYIKLFTTKFAMPAATGDPHPAYLSAVVADAKIYLLQRTLSYFGGHAPVDVIIRISLMALLVVPLALAIHQRLLNRRKGLWTLGDTWLAGSLALVAALPFLPNEVNNAHYFAARLVLFAWLAALAAASASSWRPGPGVPRLPLAISLVVILLNAMVLSAAEHRVRPIARDIAQVETTPAPFHDRVGMLLRRSDYLHPLSLSFDPYLWAGVTFFRDSDSVLLNSPWLVFSVMPLQATGLLPTDRISPSAMEQPEIFGKLLIASSAARQMVLPSVSFSILSTGVAPNSPTHPPTQPDPDSPIDAAWHCTPAGWYSLCQK